METTKKAASTGGAKGGTKGGARPGAGRPKKGGQKTSVYVSPEAAELWAATAKKLGIQKTPVLEMALREFAAKHGVE